MAKNKRKNGNPRNLPAELSTGMVDMLKVEQNDATVQANKGISGF
ncbi:hypothetical protein [Pseudosulfitobacter sp. SM2401]